MATQHTAPVAPFHPSAWLTAFEQIGGSYALGAGQTLYLFVSNCTDADLATVMRHIIGRPERRDAIKAAIEAKRMGEAA
ncbi:hypothetical protein [Sphingomonas jatrophae]|uniref:Uncharacterized protein n=1 Tax=Sphingomonas jatrophae TaxID=1166337 RepID=A0A1I6L2R5_9SPHN|nr:hypothetical protein [Sphingomonas jatrophae]SFR97727.1 hypothetical protein SAMN05192580_2199 [Sphingomonas jatrophae]